MPVSKARIGASTNLLHGSKQHSFGDGIYICCLPQRLLRRWYGLVALACNCLRPHAWVAARCAECERRFSQPALGVRPDSGKDADCTRHPFPFAAHHWVQIFTLIISSCPAGWTSLQWKSTPCCGKGQPGLRPRFARTRGRQLKNWRWRMILIISPAYSPAHRSAATPSGKSVFRGLPSCGSAADAQWVSPLCRSSQRPVVGVWRQLGGRHLHHASYACGSGFAYSMTL